MPSGLVLSLTNFFLSVILNCMNSLKREVSVLTIDVFSFRFPV